MLQDKTAKVEYIDIQKSIANYFSLKTGFASALAFLLAIIWPYYPQNYDLWFLWAAPWAVVMLEIKYPYHSISYQQFIHRLIGFTSAVGAGMLLLFIFKNNLPFYILSCLLLTSFWLYLWVLNSNYAYGWLLAFIYLPLLIALSIMNTNFLLVSWQFPVGVIIGLISLIFIHTLFRKKLGIKQLPTFQNRGIKTIINLNLNTNADMQFIAIWGSLLINCKKQFKIADYKKNIVFIHK